VCAESNYENAGGFSMGLELYEGKKIS